MRPPLTLAVVALLLTPSLSQTSAKPAAHTKKAATHPVTVTTEDIQALRDALAAQQRQMTAQQQQIQELKQDLQRRDEAWPQGQQQLQQAQTAAAEAQSRASAAETTANGGQASVNQISGDVAAVKTSLAASTQDQQRRVSALEAVLGQFHFTGDVRIRGESLIQNCALCPDRNRARLRLRFGVEGKLNEDFMSGFLLTSGSLGDSNSPNESMANFFDRKTIGIDRAYITYQPVAHKWMSLTGGKFAYTWQRTSATFDPDLNPEGFSEKFSFDLNGPVLKNFTVQGMQLLFNENSKSDDSFAIGGQVSGKLDLGFMTSTPSFTLLNWRYVNALLNASAFAVQATTTTGGLPVPGEGPGCASASGVSTVPPCAYGPQGFTNATITVGGKPQFLSRFLYADFILNNQINTGFKRFPLSLLLEYENNLNAADHPVDSKGNLLADLGSQSHAYLFDVSMGQTRNKNDFQIGYSFQREEQDAVLASFAESENRTPTNIVEHRIYALWKLRQNVVAAYTLWYGRTLNTGLVNATKAPGVTAGQADPFLKRMQFDLIYTF